MPSNDKLSAAAHLVIARLPPERLGATKLNKILWFADIEFFRRHGRSLTGEAQYVRKDNGPCPQRMESALQGLKDRGLIAEQVRPVMHFTRRQFTALQEPDVDQFTPEEIDLLLGVALQLAPLTAKQASDLSHDSLWEEVVPNGLLDVGAGAVRFEALAAEELGWARQAFA